MAEQATAPVRGQWDPEAFAKWRGRLDPKGGNDVELPVLIGSRALAHHMKQFEKMHRLADDFDVIIDDRQAAELLDTEPHDRVMMAMCVVDKLLCKVSFRREQDATVVELLIVHHRHQARPATNPGQAALLYLWHSSHLDGNGVVASISPPAVTESLVVAVAPLEMVCASVRACALHVPTAQWFKRVHDAAFLVSHGVFAQQTERAARYEAMVVAELRYRSRRSQKRQNRLYLKHFCAARRRLGSSLRPVSKVARHGKKGWRYEFRAAAFWSKSHENRVAAITEEVAALADCFREVPAQGTPQSNYSYALRWLCTQLLPADVKNFVVAHYAEIKFCPSHLREPCTPCAGLPRSEWDLEDLHLALHFTARQYIEAALLAPRVGLLPIRDICGIVCDYDDDEGDRHPQTGRYKAKVRYQEMLAANARLREQCRHADRCCGSS